MVIFNGLNQFAQHLNNVTARTYRGYMSGLLDQIGQATAQRAIHSLGNYQSDIGPFVAWGPLQPSTLATKKRMGWGKFGRANTPLYATGALANSISYSVTSSNSVEVGTNEQKAVYLELGRSNMAPRPIFGPAALRTLPRFRNQIGLQLAAAIANVSVSASGGITAVFTP